MKIRRLENSGSIYSSNVYLIMGDWKRIADINTLVDVGSDPAILDHLERINPGAGKRKIDQVVLTHSHFDHTSLLPMIRERYQPNVFAFSPFMTGVDHVLEQGQHIWIGDRDFEVIHIPGHSMDSIALFNADEGVLFVGDAPVVVNSTNGGHEDGFVRALSDICQRNVRKIYFGHGDPILKGARSLLNGSLANARKANGQKKHAIGGNKQL